MDDDRAATEISWGAQSVALPIKKKHGVSALFSRGLDDVLSLQNNATAKIGRLVDADADDVASVISMMDQADQTFDMMMDISQRLAGSYDTIMKGL